MSRFLLLVFFLVSCGPSSLEDYRELGQNKTRKLIEELQKIQNRDQLLDAKENLSRCFLDLAELMVSAEKFHRAHPKESLKPLTFQDHELSDKLRFEIIRICRFDGGSEILDVIKTEVVNKL